MKKKGVVKGVALSETQEQKEEEALLKGRRGGRGVGGGRSDDRREGSNSSKCRGRVNLKERLLLRVISRFNLPDGRINHW